jgi:hypothetical protein
LRVLHNEQSDKNDRHHARSVAIAAMRKRTLNDVAVEDHVVCCGCSLAVITISSRPGRGRCAGRTRCCVIWQRARSPQRLRAEQTAAILSRIYPQRLSASDAFATHTRRSALHHGVMCRRGREGE